MGKTNTTTTKQPKTPRTIKVVTLVKAGVIIAALATTYVAGIYTAHIYDNKVQADAHVLASQLSKADQR